MRTLDRDASLALEVERVEHLLLHLTLLQRPGRLDQAVGQRGLAVVDVRDDAEVANMVELQNQNSSRGRWSAEEQGARPFGRARVKPIDVRANPVASGSIKPVGLRTRAEEPRGTATQTEGTGTN
jgi:hypothetical protein